MRKPQTHKVHREKLGRRAELMAALYLRLKGYRILERRYKTRSGEIDIIAERGKILAIIEVKYRKSLTLAHDSLTAKTRARIQKATDIYLSHTPQKRGFGIRYDAIFITPPLHISHMKDYWRHY